MRIRTTLAVIALAIAAPHGCGPNIDCSKPRCVNDPPRDANAVRLCKEYLANVCSNEYAAAEACIQRQGVCTNGVFDFAKYDASCIGERAAFMNCNTRR